MNTTDALTGLNKEQAIRTVVANGIASKSWRDATIQDALRFLVRDERIARRAAVTAWIRAQFEAAGAGFSGRWQ